MEGSYVYIQSEYRNTDGCDLFTVGFYAPDGSWHPESDWGTELEAGNRCHFLNGGDSLLERIDKETALRAEVDRLLKEKSDVNEEILKFIRWSYQTKEDEDYAKRILHKFLTRIK